MYLDDQDFDDFEQRFPSRFYKTVVTQEPHPIFDPEKVWEFVGQTKVWRDGSQEDLKISKITEKQHLFNILKWADKNNEQINFTLETALELGYGTPALKAIYHTEGLLALPLFIRIKERYIKLLGK